MAAKATQIRPLKQAQLCEECKSGWFIGALVLLLLKQSILLVIDDVCVFQRPMLLYEGLHDRSVKHFYSHPTVKQKITHMDTVSLTLSLCIEQNSSGFVTKLFERVLKILCWFYRYLIDFLKMFYEYEDKNADITKPYFSYYFICCIYLNIMCVLIM